MEEIKDLLDPKAMHSLSYGLFVLTAKEGDKDNGCIVNTVIQVTSTPTRIIAVVNKDNYTHDMISRTGEFNVSVLTTATPFDVFKRFGFASGRDTDKFAGFDEPRSANGIKYIPQYANALMSGRVIETVDVGTHTIFIADVTESKVLSKDKSVTYEYYFANIKPKPQPEKKKGYVCKICGYIYEGEELPEDFVCPWCKHGAADFEPLK